jgi:glucose-6-phosphate-specific signal transduction histidine kinase
VPVVRVSGDAELVSQAAHDALLDTVRIALELASARPGVEDVTVELVVSDRIALSVTDDGEAADASSDHATRLAAMSDSAAALGGTFTIAPRQPRGNALHWSVPLP